MSSGQHARMKEFLLELLAARIPPEARSWLDKALEATRPPVDKNRMLGYYTGASRKLGKVALQLSDAEKTRLEELDPELPLDHWGADEAGRAALLLSLDGMPAGEYVDLVQEAHDLGDAREQQSWLRGLSLLPGCERFLDTAVEACRTNMVSMFEAIACENPYPTRYFPELNFNQMVLKALFIGVHTARIIGLEPRLNFELSRMADDYVSEREAAGREVPPDIWLSLAPRINPEGLARVHRYLQHDDPEHRYWAAVGLGLSGNPANREALERVRGDERDERVRGALDEALQRLAS